MLFFVCSLPLLAFHLFHISNSPAPNVFEAAIAALGRSRCGVCKDRTRKRKSYILKTSETYNSNKIKEKKRLTAQVFSVPNFPSAFQVVYSSLPSQVVKFQVALRRR